MKIAFLNTWSTGSTGKIVFSLAEGLKRLGHESFFITGEHIPSPNPFLETLEFPNVGLRHKLRRIGPFIRGSEGFCRNNDTKKMIAFLKEKKVDIIHIHNIHGSFVNIQMIVDFASKAGIPIVFTLHDQWFISGRCACPENTCGKWKTGCNQCPHKNLYPKSLLDRASFYWGQKQTIVENANAHFVCPSHWLENDFKTRYPAKDITVIPNGIPPFDISNINGLPFPRDGRFVVLTAAYRLVPSKGLDDFIEIAKAMKPHKDILFVGIGADAPHSKDNLILLPRIDSKEKLLCAYANADCFLNLTHFDNYPTVNLEALCAGTPVITRDVGGAAEMVKDGLNGFAVKGNSADGFIEKILTLQEHPFDRKAVKKDAERFLDVHMIESYLRLYESILDQ